MRARSAPVPAVCSSFCVDPIGKNQHPRAHAWSVACLCNPLRACATSGAGVPRGVQCPLVCERARGLIRLLANSSMCLAPEAGTGERRRKRQDDDDLVHHDAADVASPLHARSPLHSQSHAPRTIAPHASGNCVPDQVIQQPFDIAYF